jgi:hypothetical protein
VLFDPLTAVEQGYASSVSLRRLCATHFRCLTAANYNSAGAVDNLPLQIRPIWFEDHVWTGWIHFTFDDTEHFRKFASFVSHSDNTEVELQRSDGTIDTVFTWETKPWGLDSDAAILDE